MRIQFSPMHKAFTSTNNLSKTMQAKGQIILKENRNYFYLSNELCGSDL